MRSNFFKRTFSRALTVSAPLFLLSGLLVLSFSSHAQRFEEYNATQLSLAEAVRSLVDFDYGPAGLNLSGNEAEMVAICSSYNQAVWDLGANSTDAEVATVLRQVDFIAHEEVGASGSGLSDTSINQLASLLGRVQELRGVNTVLASNAIPLLKGGAAGDDFSRLSYFVNANFGTGSKDRTSREQGFDFDSFGVTGGIDYRFSDQLFAGVALALGESDVDIDSSLGDSDTDSVSLTFYGSYYKDNWYVDGVLGFSQYDYDNQRNLFLSQVDIDNGTPGIQPAGADQFIKSSTDGDAINLSVGGGYNSELKGWQATYSARLDYTDASIDGYTEDRSNSLALEIGKQDVESLQLVLGAQFTKSYGKKWGTLNPFAGIELRNEFDDDTRVVSAQYAFDRFDNTFSFTSDDADSNYFLLSVGSSFILSHGRQAFVSFDKVIGLSDVDSNSLTAGIRFEI